MGSFQMPAAPVVTVDELSPDAVLLDVREDAEWRAGHIDTARHVPMNELPVRLGSEPATLDPEHQVVVVCRSGHRSGQVAAWLLQNGYDAANLDGGMLAWATAGRPMVSDGGGPPRVA